LKILRNRVRHRLIPYLSENYNPSLSNALNRLGDILRVDGDYLDEVTDEIFKKTCKKALPDEIVLDIASLKDHHDAIRMRLIRKAIRNLNGDLKKFTSTHFKDVLKTIYKDGTKILDLPSKVRVKKRENDLVFKKYTVPLRSLGKKSDPTPYEFEVFGDSIIEISSEISIVFHTQNSSEPKKENENIIYLDKERLTFPLKVRPVKYGDFFSPNGFSGSQKIKKYFNSNGVSEEKRWKTPVLLNNREIIWLCGYRMGGKFNVTSETRVVFKIELSLA
jgi:tRNA(Ile)-lysidine synthase